MIGFLTGRLFHTKSRNQGKSDIFLGLVLGSVAPDLDLVLLSTPIAMYMLLKGTIDWNEVSTVHRTVTHSMITSIVILGISFLLMRSQRMSHLNFQTLDHEPLTINLPLLLLGFSIGMTMHALTDLFYISDVALFWPILPNRQSFFHVSFFSLDPFFQRIFIILDVLPEPAWWLTLVLWSHRTKNNLSSNDRKWLVLATIYLAFIIAFLIVAFFIPNEFTEPFLILFLSLTIWMYILTVLVVWHYKELFYVS